MMEDVEPRGMQSAGPGIGELAASLNPASTNASIAGLFADHAGPLRQYVLRRFGPGPPEPEEVVQAAFARLTERGDFATIRDARGFLYAVACNFVIDNHRRHARRQAVAEDVTRHEALSLSHPTPERVLLAKEQLKIVESALKAMPAMRRRIFLMVRVEGIPPAEVARAFAISATGVHKHVSRALADCAAAIAAAEAQIEDFG